MEFCDGGAINIGKMGATQRNLVAVSLAKAILHLHSLGIVHQDIKPSNILMSGGKAKLSDFGNAQEFQLSLSQTRLALSLFYAAPELHSGSAKASPAADMYSFGLILFELVTQKPVFDPATSIAQVVDGARNDAARPSIPREVHPDVRSVIERCWKAEPSERPAMIDVCEQLQRIGWCIAPGADVATITKFVAGLPLESSMNQDVQAKGVLMLEEMKKQVEVLAKAKQEQEKAVTAAVARANRERDEAIAALTKAKKEQAKAVAEAVSTARREQEIAMAAAVAAANRERDEAIAALAKAKEEQEKAIVAAVTKAKQERDEAVAAAVKGDQAIAILTASMNSSVLRGSMALPFIANIKK
jgi:serine/threonine protein kinase